MKDFLKIFEVSTSALLAQRFRLNIISSNLANAETTKTPEGGPYKRKDVVFSTFIPSFDELLAFGLGQFLKGVKVSGVIEDPRPPKAVFNPSHPDADKSGYVLMPNVNPLEEMVNLMAASRSYEANLEVFNTAKAMFLKALEIGRV